MTTPEISRRPECLIAEDMLADALDGTLTAADQAWLDDHVAICPACAASLAGAKRGAAWLDVLKLTRPEPSPDLFARIIAQTSGAAPQLLHEPVQPILLEALQPLPIPTNLLTFPTPSARRGAFSRIFLEPRLAMTAAMAFFSIALTLNLTGIRLNELHASDLSPTALRHDFYQARAGAVRHYDSLRVVHVLESRVDDMRDARFHTQEAQPESTPQPITPAHPQRESIAKPRTSGVPRNISLGNAPFNPQAASSLAASAVLAPYSGGL